MIRKFNPLLPSFRSKAQIVIQWSMTPQNVINDNSDAEDISLNMLRTVGQEQVKVM